MRLRRSVGVAPVGLVAATIASATRTADYIAEAHGLAATHHAELSGPHGACFTSCQLPLNFIVFEDMKLSNHESLWESRILSRQYMTSVAACMASYCSSMDIDEGWERLALFRDLAAPGTPVPPIDEILLGIPNIDGVPLIDVFGHIGETFNETVLVTRNNFLDGQRTQVSST